MAGLLRDSVRLTVVLVEAGEDELDHVRADGGLGREGGGG
jgi:hypothetical protein